MDIDRGGPLENGLRRVLRDVLIGSLLIQRDPKNGEPLLLHLSLPQCVRVRESAKSAWVLLLDSQVVIAMPHYMAKTDAAFRLEPALPL